MINTDLILQVLRVALFSSIITTTLVQRIKEGIKIKNSKSLIWISLAVSLIFGTAFSLIFSDLNIIYSICSGFITWLGADAIYKAFEEKFSLSLKKEE